MSTSPERKIPHFVLETDLVELASERSSERRIELLHRITDAYVTHPDQHSSTERYLFEEIISELIEKVTSQHRAEASVKLAGVSSLSGKLAYRLASDSDIAVARPIIRDYRDLSEQSLIDVAKKGSLEHLNTIAGRSVVTPPVTDIVVTRGDQRVVRTLAANHGAQFSPKGMDTLIGKAKADTDIQALLVERGDLSLDAISKLLPMISDELASRLRGTVAEIDETVVREHLNEWAKDRQKDVERADAYIDSIKKGDLNLNDVMLQLVRGKRLLDAATVLAAIVNLDRNYAFNLLTGGDFQAVVLLLKSANLAWPAAEGFLRLRNAKVGVERFEPLPSRGEYEKIDVAIAQRIVRFMKVRRVAKAS